jgi:hypothetical protein
MANENRPHHTVKWSTGGRGEMRHGRQQDRRGPHFTRHTILDTPPPLNVEWKEGSGIHLSTVDQGELISTIRELHIRFWTPPPHPHR